MQYIDPTYHYSPHNIRELLALGYTESHDLSFFLFDCLCILRGFDDEQD